MPGMMAVTVRCKIKERPHQQAQKMKRRMQMRAIRGKNCIAGFLMLGLRSQSLLLIILSYLDQQEQ